MTGRTFEDGDMERSVQFLEKGFEKIDGKLDRLLDTLVAFRRETDLRFGAVDARFGTLENQMEARFGALENRMEARFGAFENRMEARFGAVEARLERIDATLEYKASAADVAEVRGMVRSLPTIVHMITLAFGILAGAFAILRYGLPRP